MTAEERAERATKLQNNVQAVFNMVLNQELTTEQGRIALELLQLMADLIDFSDSLARRAQTR